MLAALALAPSACTGVPMEGSATASGSSAGDPGTTGAAETSGTSGGSGPAINNPEPTSLLCIIENTAGERLPEAWIKVLPKPLPPPVTPTYEMEVQRANSAGHVQLEGLDWGDLQIMIGAPGYATRTEVIRLDDGVQSSVKLQLMPKGESFPVDLTAGSDLTYKNVHIHLPPGPMRDKRTGMLVKDGVTATVTVANPATGDLAPVPLVGEDLAGDASLLESFGMVGVELTRDGHPVELAVGAFAEVSFVLSEDLAKRVELLGITTIPAWHADPEKGEVMWKEIGTFVLSTNDEGKLIATTADVTEFSWINTDLKVGDPRCYVVTMIDGKTKEPLAGYPMDFEYGWSKPVVTGNDGSVCFDILPDTQATVTVADVDPLVVKSTLAHPKSVCAQNNWSGYQNYPHGTCTHYIIEVGATNVCVPGSTWACDDEKPFPGTEKELGVGVCRAAQRVCEDGSGWSECLDPIGPSPEICDPNSPVQLDEDCDGEINEENCNCVNNDPPNPCYPGDYDAEVFPGSMCMPGTQMCDGGFWGLCMGDTPPNPEAEDCYDPNGIESCQKKTCDFDDLAWREVGDVGRHEPLAVHIAGDVVTNLSRISLGGDTASYGTCFTGMKKFLNGFNGLALSTHSIGNGLQSCQSANILQGTFQSVFGDSGAQGTAVAGRASSDVPADLNGVNSGCQAPIPSGEAFVTHYSVGSACTYRVQIPGNVTIKDVAVGETAFTAYVAGVLPAGQNLAFLDCAVAPGAKDRAFYARIERTMPNTFSCTVKTHDDEQPEVLGVSDGRLAVAAYDTTALDQTVRARVLDPVSLMTVQLKDEVAVADGGNVTPMSIAVHGDKIAVAGEINGKAVLLGNDAVDTGDKETDLFVVVVNPQDPTGKGRVLGKGTQGNDNNDSVSEIAWVEIVQPPGIGLVVGGNTSSKDLDIGCGSNTNPDDMMTTWDGYVALLTYEGSVLTCLDQHALTNDPKQPPGNQRVTDIAVDNLRVSVSGWFDQDIKLGGELLQPYSGVKDRHGHIGVLKAPVKPF